MLKNFCGFKHLLSWLSSLGCVCAPLEGESMGGVYSRLRRLFSRRPATPPPPVQKMADAARIIGEARRKVGVDCMNHYNFAACGQSGVGKSSFINELLCLKGDDACSVGEIETTQEIAIKRAPHLMVWDIPGAGTSKHPANTYFEDKKLYVFDCILILSADRCLAVDFEILRSACKYGTPCAFVRTKCDISVHCRAQRDGSSTLTASKNVRKDVESSFHAGLAEAGLQNLAPVPKLFFISSKLFSDDDAYDLCNKKAKTWDTSLASMDEQELTCFIHNTAKVRAPPPASNCLMNKPKEG